MTDRPFSEVFAPKVDAAAPWDTDIEYVGTDRVQFSIRIPATEVNGPFVDGESKTLKLDTTYNAEYIADRTAADSVAAIADDAATVTEIALMRIIGEVGESPTSTFGPAVERIVYQRNRGDVMVFGDLQFRVPSSGNSSLQFRSASGLATISNFITKWSNQQGGASENNFGFAIGSSWLYFRANGALNLTLHNSYQEGRFVCNGWMYHVEVIVGSSWTNNRFSFTRWRLEGVKGDAGTNGVDGADGTNGVDGADAASIDHVSLTAGDSSPGTTDTYTLWADAGETVALGTYDVPIPAAAGIQTVELASYTGAHTAGRTLTLAGGRMWQDVLDEFQFVYVIVGANSLFSHDQSRQWHVSDLGVQSIDMAITDYQTHGSTAYHYRLRCPAANSTTVLIDNDGSNMTVQRIKVIGIK